MPAQLCRNPIVSACWSLDTPQKFTLAPSLVQAKIRLNIRTLICIDPSLWLVFIPSCALFRSFVTLLVIAGDPLLPVHAPVISRQTRRKRKVVRCVLPLSSLFWHFPHRRHYLLLAFWRHWLDAVNVVTRSLAFLAGHYAYSIRSFFRGAF